MCSRTSRSTCFSRSSILVVIQRESHAAISASTQGLNGYHAPRIDFRLQTPTGRLIEPWRAASEAGMRFVQGRQLTLYRLALPVPVLPDRFDQGGTWHALLRLGEPRTKPTREREDGTDPSILEGLFANPALRGRAALPAAVPGSDLRRRFEVTRLAEAHLESSVRERRPVPRERRSARYSLLVHSYSNISIDARVEQSGWEPGARVTVSATLYESGIAMERPASVWAEWTRPDGTMSNLALPAVEAGRYLASFDATQPGIHALRVRARGTSAQGMPFTRERTITAAVWRGGDRDAETAAGGGGRVVDAVTGRDGLCDLLRCLVGEGRAIEPALERRLREAGLNIGALRKCIDAHCKPRRDSDRDE